MNLFRKKGDVNDYIMFLVMIFFLAISMVVVAYTNDKFTSVIETTPLNDTIVAPKALTQMDTITTTTIQNAFIFMFGMLIIGMMVTSFMVRIHPIFLFVYIIFLAVTIFVGVPLANTYQELINTPAMVSVASQQTMITWIMQHLTTILLAVGALSMIVTFGKLTGGQGADYAI